MTPMPALATLATLRSRRAAAGERPGWPALLIALAIMLLPALAHAVTMSIVPADTTVEIGDTLVVRIVTDGVPDLRAFETIHQYDPSRLELISADPGELITGAGHPYAADLRNDDAAPQDSLWYDAAMLDGSASGPGVLVYARFRAMAPGAGALDCRKVEFRDALNQPTLPACAGTVIHVIPIQRTLTLATAGNGSVAADPVRTTYDDGTSVSITATPAPCWHLQGWSGSASGAVNPLTLVMDADKSVTATFAIDTHILDASAGAGGTIAPSGPVVVGCGNPQAFTISPSEGHVIADVVVDGVSRGALTSYAFANVTAGHTIAASFTILGYTLATSVTGSGSVGRAPDLASYPHFTGVTLTATPATGWHFAGWSGDTTASSPSLPLTMKRDRTLVAAFAIDTHALTITKAGRGSVAASPSQALYDYGTVVMLTPTAAPGWFFTGWTGDATGAAIPLAITMDAAHAVTANFGYTPPAIAELTLGGHDETTENVHGAGSWNASSGTTANPGYVAAGVTGSHLMISEIGLRGINSATVNDSTEFIEIYNPALTAVDLSRYYLADVNGYSALPMTGKIDVAASLTDFAFRFPAGATIGPGEARVVAVLAGSYKRGVGRDADYAMFTAGNGSTAVPMVDVMKNKSVGYPGYGMLSNTGEFVWLFYWDGACDLVTDVDLVSWGAPSGSNAPSLKVSMCQDGGDWGTAPTCYAADAGPIDDLATPGNGAGTRQRIGPETESGSGGGNGQAAKAAPNLALGSSPASPDCDTAITLTATLTPAAAAGTVTFYDGGTPLGSAPVTSGLATLTGVELAAGTHSITAEFGGDCGDLGATSPPVTLTVTQTATALALAVTPEPSVCGAGVTLTATATPSGATGSITFLNGATPIGTAPLVSGVANLAVTSLTVGSHSLSATYDGSACFLAAASPAVAHDVHPAPTSVNVTSSAPATSCGLPFTLTAHVTPAAAGTAEFFDGATSLGSAAVTAGSGSLGVAGLAVGTHAITAVFAADDGCHTGGTSPEMSEVVGVAASALALGSSPMPSACGQTVQLTATVTPVAGGGSVEFFDGATSLGTAPVAAGVATLAVPGFTLGTHALTATFSGDACAGGATSPERSQLVTQTTPAIAFGTDVNPAVWELVIVLTATLDAPATGSVQFFDGTASLGIAPASGGVATLPVGGLAVGTHDLTAVYSGDACFTPVTSAVFTQTITSGTVAVALASDANPAACGATVTLTATTRTTATGTVQFMDGPNLLGAAALDAGTATLSLAGLTPGGHALTAVYTGDGRFAPATSPEFDQIVTTVPSSVSLASDATPSVHGAPVLLTATVTPASATGSVQFLDSLTFIGEAPVAGGVATLSVSTLAGGVHTQIIAVFTGGGCHGASISSAWTQLVHRAPSAAGLTSDLNPAFVGAPLTLEAHVEPVTATGFVEFFDGATSLGTAAVANGVAWLTLTPAAAGTVDATAHYLGDDSYEGSLSPSLAVPVVVNPAPTVTVLSPNGGEVLAIGSHATVTWIAADDQGVASVSIAVSRDNGGTWQDIATAVSNTGSFDWLVTPPQTNSNPDPRFTALIRVTAKDGLNRIGADQSDAAFAIFSATTDVTPIAGPGEFALRRVWPNPAHVAVSVDYAIPAESKVRLSLVDLQGREVAVLADGVQAAGRYQARCDGRANGAPLPAGVYFVRLDARGAVLTRRFVLVR